MVGYRALNVPEGVHRGMPSSMLTFIVSLDDGVEAGDTPSTLAVARPTPLLLGGLHVQASHVRQRRGQAGVQLAVHPLAARALFGVPSAKLPVAEYDAAAVLDRGALELHERVTEAHGWPDVFALVARYLVAARRHREGATVRPGRHRLQRPSAHDPRIRPIRRCATTAVAGRRVPKHSRRRPLVRSTVGA